MDREGDQTTWHIRLSRKVGDIEVWRLWKGDEPQSSEMPKSVVQKWLGEEIAKKTGLDFPQHKSKLKRRIDRMTQKKYVIHPLALLFPAVAGKAFNDLVADIKAHGLLNPIVRQGHTIIDGRTRLEACKQARVTPKFVEFSSLGQKCTVENYIWSSNVERRHLTEDQRAVVAHEWANALAEQARARQVAALKKGKVVQMKSKSAGPAKPNATRRAVAEQGQVSVHKIQQVEMTKKHAPELVKKVASGKMKLRDAAKIAAKRIPKRKAQRARLIVHPLSTRAAVGKVVDSFAADVKNILPRVTDHGAFFRSLLDHVESFCRKMKKAA